MPGEYPPARQPCQQERADGTREPALTPSLLPRMGLCVLAQPLQNYPLMHRLLGEIETVTVGARLLQKIRGIFGGARPPQAGFAYAARASPPA